MTKEDTGNDKIYINEQILIKHDFKYFFKS